MFMQCIPIKVNLVEGIVMMNVVFVSKKVIGKLNVQSCWTSDNLLNGNLQIRWFNKTSSLQHLLVLEMYMLLMTLLSLDTQYLILLNNFRNSLIHNLMSGLPILK